jgi:N-acetylneuraminic acid mutarotase
LLNTVQRTAYKFDPPANSWSQVESMSPTGDESGYRASAAACAIAGYGYVISGVRNSSLDQWSTKRYDPIADTWTDQGIANISAPVRHDHGAAAFGSKAYVCGGIAGSNNDTGGGGYLTDTDVYDPDANTWTTGATMPGSARAALGVAAL